MKHGHPVRTFSADGANQWLQARRLPRAARSDAFVADSHAFDPSAEGCAMNRIGISQVICGRGLVRKGANDLLGDPFGSGRFRDVEVNDFTSLGREHDQHVQQPASHGGDHKEVQGGNGPRVVAQNSPPALGWPAPGLGPLLPNSSGPGVEPQCCQLIADAGTAPGRVCGPHAADDLDQPRVLAWSTTARLRLPSPEQPESSPLPIDDGRGPKDQQCASPVGSPSFEHYPQPVVLPLRSGLTPLSLEHLNLVPKGYVLQASSWWAQSHDSRQRSSAMTIVITAAELGDNSPGINGFLS